MMLFSAVPAKGGNKQEGGLEAQVDHLGAGRDGGLMNFS